MTAGIQIQRDYGHRPVFQNARGTVWTGMRWLSSTEEEGKTALQAREK